MCFVSDGDGRFTMCGGTNGVFSYLADCWTTTDNGATWARTVDSAPWGLRRGAGCASTTDGLIFLAGGTEMTNVTSHARQYRDDVWATSDSGASWTQLTSSAGFMGREQPSLVYVSSRRLLVVLAGYAQRGFNRYYFNDVWTSMPGATGDLGADWAQDGGKAGWVGRVGQSAVAIGDNQVVVAGGMTDIFSGSCLSDAWVGTFN